MSLRKKIILTLCFTLIFMMVILSTLIYSKSATILNKTATLHMTSQLERAKENIDLRLQITKLETEKLALDESVLMFCEGALTTPETNRYLKVKMENMDQGMGYYKDLFIMDLKGVIRATTMTEAQDIDLSTRAYLKESQRTLNTITSDALIARSDGSLIVNTVTPIYNSENQVVGYAGIAIKAAYFSKIVSDLKLGDKGYYGIVDSNNRILAHPNPELIYKELPYEITNLIKRQNGAYVHNGTSIFNDQENVFQSYQYIDSNRWYLIASLPEREHYSQSILLLSYVIIAGGFGIIIAIGMGYYMGNQITKPIIAITETLENLTSGQQLIQTTVHTSISDFEESERWETKEGPAALSETKALKALSTIPDHSTISDHLKVTSEYVEDKPSLNQAFTRSFQRAENSIKASEKDEIGNLRQAIYGLKEYLTSISGFFEKESEKLMAESNQVTQSINSMSFNTARFIATLSHDLKTSVTLIKGYAKGLNTGIIKDIETREQFLKGILRSAEDIEHITCDILDHAYEAQCVPKLKKEMISAKLFSEELIGSSKQLVEEANHQFQAHVHLSENPLINIDHVKIKRVWQNLLGNAIKYSEDRSLIVCEIKQIESLKLIEFKIIDHGIGIRPEYLSHLQSMFFRGRETDSKGYGLGLFIAGSILEAHDSKLEIDSKWGGGTEAYFYLQLHDNP